MLLHHLAELQKVKSKLDEAPSEQISDNDAEKSRHIQVLLKFLEPDIQKTIKPAQKRLEKSVPTVTFDDIWYLLRPGLLCYFIHDGVWIGCVMKMVTKKNNEDGQAVWEVETWSQDSRWTKAGIGCAIFKIDIAVFDGEKLVTSLSVFPRDYYDSKDETGRKAAFRKRGRFLCDILWNGGYSYVNYDGKLMTESDQQVR